MGQPNITPVLLHASARTRHQNRIEIKYFPGIRNGDMSTVRVGIPGMVWTSDTGEAGASGEGHKCKGFLAMRWGVAGWRA